MILLQCQRCLTTLHLNNAQKEYGELIITCPICQAKNIVAPFVFQKIVIPDWWQIVGWRD